MEGYGILYEEHVLLGASFVERGERMVPTSYCFQNAGDVDFGTGAVLSDLSGMTMLLASGAPSQDFVHAALSGRQLGVGEVAFEASLLGDGTIASVPLVFRTGDHEYVICDDSPRSELLASWLSFIANVEQDGVKPYEGLETEDVSDSLVPLMLWGGAAQDVLGDYLRGEEGVPAKGRVASLALDGRIPTLVAHLAVDDFPCFLLFVDPKLVRVMWRSLLSFPQVSPVAPTHVSERMAAKLPWLKPLSSAEDKVRMSGEELRSFGVTRKSYDFVGARGLVG